MHKFIIADAHCDTISGLYRKPNLYKSEGHLDIQRMQQYKNWLQFFAIWIDCELSKNEQRRRFCEILSNYKSELANNANHIAHANNAGDINAAFAQDRIASFLTLEGGDYIENDISRIQDLYAAGVRLITLTWNNSNAIGTGAGEKNPAFGLSEFGRQAVLEMNRLGIIVDVSHLSERGFWDVAQVCQKPFIASHSNARHICDHVRNLTDEQFLHIKSVGGVVGMNFYPVFVTNKNEADIDDMIKHIDHFMSLGGEDTICLGSDFDGIDYALDDLPDAQYMYRLPERLLKLGYNDAQVEKITNKNLIRVISDICGHTNPLLKTTFQPSLKTLSSDSNCI